MSPVAALASNKQWAGYCAGWVFCGRGAAGWENSGGARGVLGGRRRLDLGRWLRIGGHAAGPSGLAVPIMGNQALSGMVRGVVARLASHRGSGMADFRAFRGACRLIDSYQTRHGSSRSGQLQGRAGRQAEGGRFPLSPSRAVPMGVARPGPEIWKVPGQRGAAFGPLATASAVAGCQGVRNIQNWQPGSGVRGTRKRAASGAVLRRKRDAICDGVRGSGAHISLDLGRTHRLGAGIG